MQTRITRTCCILLALILFIVLVGCVSNEFLLTEVSDKDTSNESEESDSIIQQSLFDGGFPIEIQGDWIIYKGSDNKLYKVNADGTERKKICDDTITDIF